MKTFCILLVASAAFALTSCSNEQSPPSTSSTETQVTHPGEDFYLHINRQWLKQNPLPADKASYTAFTEVHDRTQEQLKVLMKNISAESHPVGSDMARLADFYNSYMDQERTELLGLDPLSDELQKISDIEDLDGLVSAFASLGNIHITTPMNWYVDNDEKQATEYRTYLTQSGLGLPERDYYLEDKESYLEARAAYKQYIQTLMELAGFTETAAAAERIIALETKIAEFQWSAVDRRDVEKAYNKFDLDALQQLLGDSLKWSTYARGAGLETAQQVIVRQPSYTENLGKLVSQTPLSTWRHYLRFHLLDGYAPLLSSEFVDTHFRFHKTALSGIAEQKPRWKRAMSGTNRVVGELLGKAYTDKHFTPEAKAEMKKLVDNLIIAFKHSIQDLDWMSPVTKQAALNKLAKFTPKIGYPDKWKDYSKLVIRHDDLVGNVIRHGHWESHEYASRLGKPIDKTVWYMTPQTVNAYYNPSLNEIVFPAAILQPPFFDLTADAAYNYGAIGAVIGHEIGHGFDDQGAKYDGDGNINNWWQDSDKQEFQRRKDMLIAQFNAYQPLPDMHVNGELTVGENIGDLGGLTVAYKAHQLSLNGKAAPIIDGQSGDQRLFTGWARIWRNHIRDKKLRQYLAGDPHSPGKYRVNGIVRNLPEFYEAYEVTEQQSLYLAPESRVKIW
ncbi:MAG: M13 family metallopeptidase [bacterium]